MTYLDANGRALVRVYTKFVRWALKSARTDRARRARRFVQLNAADVRLVAVNLYLANHGRGLEASNARRHLASIVMNLESAHRRDFQRGAFMRNITRYARNYTRNGDGRVGRRRSKNKRCICK